MPASTDFRSGPLDRALDRLGSVNPRAAEVVFKRLFGEQSLRDIARHMGLSPTTVQRDWTVGRALLRSWVA